jgi:GNAT superfamily N-acetyltransferase
MIRLATKWDRDAVVGMLNHYKLQSPIEFQRVADDSQAYTIFDNIYAGAGVCFVSEDKGVVNGFLMAVRNPNVWDPLHYALQELAYWVEPEHRGGTAGYKLLKTYRDYCADLLAEQKITYYTVTKMSNSPDLKYDKFGFEKLEETWMIQ